MKRISFFVLCLYGLGCLAQSQRDACTSIMAGRLATTDGSVITSHTCDSWYRTWMNIVWPEDYPGDAVTTVYEGLMHTEHSQDMTNVHEKGKIPQARHTYRYLNTAYPCLNEHQLAIGETTYGGRQEMQNKKGMFLIEELARIALERCKTAREAIVLMGELAQKYGYGDSGECLTIADPKEVWIFEIQGEGPNKLGAVWAAQRIPDDHIAVSANVSRIGYIDTDDKENYLYSDNVFSVARKMKLWDGKSKFSFWRAYSGGNYFKEEKNYSVRELAIMRALAPSANLTDTVSDLPVSIKPDEKVDVQRISQLLGSYYEGTGQSLSTVVDSVAKGKKAMITNPWMRPDEIALYSALTNDTTMQNIRTVSVSWCAYSTVIQCRSWLPDEIGGVAWIALDNPGQSPRFPVFAGCTKLPAELSVCGQHRERDDAALWHYRKANRLATVRWGQTRGGMMDAQRYFLEKGKRELPVIEQCFQSMTDEAERTRMLNGYTADFYGATVSRWDQLARAYWRKFWAGF